MRFAPRLALSRLNPAESQELPPEKYHLGKPPPALGWAGRWFESHPEDYVAFVPLVLKETLTDQGFEHEAMVRTWRDRGRLQVRSSGGGRGSVSLETGTGEPPSPAR